MNMRKYHGYQSHPINVSSKSEYFLRFLLDITLTKINGKTLTKKKPICYLLLHLLLGGVCHGDGSGRSHQKKQFHGCT